MKMFLKRNICIVLVFVLCLGLLGSVVSADESKDSVSIVHAEGWLESAYVKWSEFSGADWYNVYYKENGSEYIKLDDELVRKYPDCFRADALGLSEGEYVLKVVPTKNEIEITNAATETEVLTVVAHTREGFAFSENSVTKTASGAYNDDGTIRDDADIIYITNGNKDTVTINGDESLGVGLYNILANREAKKIKSTLVIRILGRIEEPLFVDNHTVRFINTGNVTLEGVGDDAVIFGWIMTLKRAENFEIRNIAMMYGGLGCDAGAIVLDTDNKNVWIHNCDFFYGAPGKDADQLKGDGAIDLKSRSDYVTISYNHYWDMGKTNVSGGPWEVSNVDKDDRAKVFITYHHNWFDHSDSRHPRCVAGSNHVYNNYYDGNAMYGIGAAVKTSVFSESNYYRNCGRPMIIASQGSDCWDEASQTYKSKGTLSGQIGGMIKSYGDVIVGATRFYDQNTTPHEGHIDAYTAISRNEKVPDTTKAFSGGATYNNFDTDESIMYEYNADTPEEAVQKIESYAGRVDGGDFKWHFDNEVEDENHEVIIELLNAILAYRSELLVVADGKIPVEPPVILPTSTPIIDPDSTPKPTIDPNTTPKPNTDGVKEISAGTQSYAKDWFGGSSMSAGDLSNDEYIFCYKGKGNSYKTNNFAAQGLNITRGYQTKQIDSRSFYCRPAEECMVTVYFYSSGTNSLALYTTSETHPVATFVPDKAGDYAFTYHFTDVGYPLYIAGPDGDINLAGISVEESINPTKSPVPTGSPIPSQTPVPTDFDYEITTAFFDADDRMVVELKYSGSAQNPNAKLLVAEYNITGDILIGLNIYDVDGIDIKNFEYQRSDSAVCKLMIWDGMDKLTPLSNPMIVE